MSQRIRVCAASFRSTRATIATATPRQHPQKASRPPPGPRAYRPTKTSASEQNPEPEPSTETSESAQNVSALSFLWPFGKTKPAPAAAPAPATPIAPAPALQAEPPQVEATENGETVASRVVDRKDPLYRATATNWIGIICGLTLVIGLSWPLYERLVLGVEQKKSLATHKEEHEKAVVDGLLAEADGKPAG